jgi:heterodisulfide reductase subunit C
MTAALDYSPARRRSFLSEVDALSGQHVELCYHCHTCSAGCLVSEAMTYGPDRVLRLIELGERAGALSAPDIWLCVGCETCSARCPNGIDVARVMDTLRHLSLAQRADRETRRLRLFHDIYMQVVRHTGRSSEAVMLGLYKVLGLDLFSDLGAGLQLILRGKIPIMPERIRDRQQVNRLFAEARKADIAEQAVARSREVRLP